MLDYNSNSESILRVNHTNFDTCFSDLNLSLGSKRQGMVAALLKHYPSSLDLLVLKASGRVNMRAIVGLYGDDRGFFSGSAPLSTGK